MFYVGGTSSSCWEKNAVSNGKDIEKMDINSSQPRKTMKNTDGT